MAEILIEATSWAPTGIQLLCSSRNLPDLEKVFVWSHNPNVIEIHIEEENIKSDIQMMIEDNIKRKTYLSTRLEHTSPDFRRHIVRSLCDGAKRMFLLPKRMVEELDSKTNEGEMVRYLEDLPRDLNEYYLRLLKRIHGDWRPMAKKILIWLIWAKRPLPIAELNEVFALDGAYPQLEMDAKAACGTLVLVEDNTIRLSHTSVKRFFLESCNFKSDPIYFDYVDPAHDDHIAQVCVDYLFDGEYLKPKTPKDRFAPPGGKSEDQQVATSIDTTRIPRESKQSSFERKAQPRNDEN